MTTQHLVSEIRDRLTSRQQRLAVAESLTGGRIQSLITAVSGASTFFEGGITTYTLDQKLQHLNVDREHAASCNCVSAQVAEEMAAGVCELFGVEYGVATTGYAQTDPENGITTPHAFIAVCQTGKEESKIVQRTEWMTPANSTNEYADRNKAQDYFAQAAIKMIHELVLRRFGD